MTLSDEARQALRALVEAPETRLLTRVAVVNRSGDLVVHVGAWEGGEDGPGREERAAWAAAFASYDDTMTDGVVVNGQHHDVHRWYETSIYGRRGDSRRGEGFALVRASPDADLVVACSWGFPVLSSRAVPAVQTFVVDHAAAVATSAPDVAQ